jgi:hypothetical protein
MCRCVPDKCNKDGISILFIPEFPIFHFLLFPEERLCQKQLEQVSWALPVR